MDFIENDTATHIVSERTLLALHKMTVDKILPPELSGQYRTKRVVIKDTQTGLVTFKPPDPEEVPYLVNEFFKWLEMLKADTMHPVIKAGIAHFELVRIHPFLDGNGRVARALATLMLYADGYDIRRFFSLEEYFDKDPLTYYEHLQEAGKGDLTPWLDFTRSAEELERIKDKIKKLSTDSHKKKNSAANNVFK